MNLGGSIHINKKGYLVLTIVCTLLFILYLNNENKSETKVISLKQLLFVSINAAENGGIEVVSASKHDLKIESKGKTKEGMDDRVSNADYMSHCAMMATIKTTFPNLNLISEEGKRDCESIVINNNNNKLQTIDINDEIVLAKDLTVWIDPLDATYEYTHQLYQYVTTMVCVALKGTPIIGVIHNPFLKNTTWAWVGKSSNIKQIRLPSITNKRKVTVIVSMSHPGEVKEVLHKQFTNKELEIQAAAGAGKDFRLPTRVS